MARYGWAARRNGCQKSCGRRTPRLMTRGPIGSPSIDSSRTSRSGDRGYELISWVQDPLPLLESVPMLIAWGMKDFVFDEPVLDEWIRRFPAAGGHRFPRAGHLPVQDEAGT